MRSTDIGVDPLGHDVVGEEKAPPRTRKKQSEMTIVGRVAREATMTDLRRLRRSLRAVGERREREEEVKGGNAQSRRRRE